MNPMEIPELKKLNIWNKTGEQTGYYGRIIDLEDKEMEIIQSEEEREK